MTFSIKSEHVCPPDRTPLPYIALFVDCNDRVMVQCKGDRLCYPRLECPEVPHFGEKMCECFRDRFEEMCGTKYEVLFLHATINNYYFAKDRPIHAIFQCVSPIDGKTSKVVSPVSKEYKWMEIKEVDFLVEDSLSPWVYEEQEFSAHYTLTRPEHMKCAEDGYRPWELPMWHINTALEAKDALARLGYVVKGKFEQWQITHNSAVLRVATSKGHVYLKASNRREGKVTDLIAEFAPELVRKPILVNEEKGWMLMNDYGTVVNRSNKAEYERFCIPIGQLHLESIRHLETLKEAGVSFQSAQSFIQRTEKMLKDKGIGEIMGKCDAFQSCTHEGVADLQEYCEAVCELLRDLYENGKCPLSLVHGDLPDNMIKGYDDSCILFDWGAARIDFPLCDLLAMESNVSSDVFEEYLSLWEAYASPSELRSLFGIIFIKVRLIWVLREYEEEIKLQPINRLEDITVDMLGNLLVDAKEEIGTRKLQVKNRD